MNQRVLRMMCLLPLLASCSATSTPAVDDASKPASVETAAVMDPAMLAAYHWRLHQATDRQGARIDELFVQADKPVQLDFSEGRVSILNACNSMSGSTRIAEGRLTVGPLIGTKRACADPALNNLDQAVAKRMQGSLRMEIVPGAAPVLRLDTEAGDSLEFASAPTDATRFGSEGETIFLEVAAQMQPCRHVMDPAAQCLRVRERHYDAHGLQAAPPGEWYLLHQGIKGYTHEVGVRNVLRLKRYVNLKEAADPPATVLVLDMVVESEHVAGSDTPP